MGTFLAFFDQSSHDYNYLQWNEEITCLMELPIVHLYQGTWQFHEAIEFMADAGFVPAQIHPVNFHSTDRVSLIEVDCLFRPRRPARGLDRRFGGRRLPRFRDLFARCFRRFPIEATSIMQVVETSTRRSCSG